MRISEIASAVEGRIEIVNKEPGIDEKQGIESVDCYGAVVDSRKITPGCVFVATKGARVDGHDYIGKALEAGAACAICEHIPDLAMITTANAVCIVVEDSFIALKKLATWYRTKLSCKIVGIIGSVGKTSTKELVASVLSAKFKTQKTEGNFNNEVGVPLTILSMRPDTEMAVVEMGISDFGEMDRLGQIVKPDGVVMTNIGPCHLEFLHNLDGVLKAKTEVIPHISQKGFLCLNIDDEKLAGVKETGGRSIIYYGSKGASYATELVSKGLEGSEFTLNIVSELIQEKNLRLSESTSDESLRGLTSGDQCTQLSINTSVALPGRHMVQNALAAAAVGFKFGMSLEEISSGIKNAKSVSGRSNLIKTDKYLIVDDCYNANPKSMRAAIDLLQDALSRKVAILGDMFELGEDEASLHAGVGRYAVEKNIDLLICVGSLSKHMYDAACEKKGTLAGQIAGHATNVLYYTSREDLLSELGSLFMPGDTILVKASHGMGFSEVVAGLQ